jgi:hypothetical protein
MTGGTLPIRATYPDGMPSHDERLRVPWSWWPVLAGIVALGCLEIASGFTYVVVVPVAVFLVAFFILPLLLAGRVRVRLADGVLQAGDQELPVMAIRSAEPLDRQQTRLRLGPQADPAAHLVVRGWVGPSVMLRLSNPTPVPYWIVSTRHPEELAAAIKASRTAIRAAR